MYEHRECTHCCTHNDLVALFIFFYSIRAGGVGMSGELVEAPGASAMDISIRVDFSSNCAPPLKGLFTCFAFPLRVDGWKARGNWKMFCQTPRAAGLPTYKCLFHFYLIRFSSLNYFNLMSDICESNKIPCRNFLHRICAYTDICFKYINCLSQQKVFEMNQYLHELFFLFWKSLVFVYKNVISWSVAFKRKKSDVLAMRAVEGLTESHSLHEYNIPLDLHAPRLLAPHPLLNSSSNASDVKPNTHKHSRKHTASECRNIERKACTCFESNNPYLNLHPFNTNQSN